MRALVQRVSRAEVRVDGRVTGRIGPGLLVMVAIRSEDKLEDAKWLAEKIVNLRILDHHAGKMDRALLESAGDVLCVSEFTLYGDCRRGRRPNYFQAAPPDAARPLYEAFVEALCALVSASGGSVETGQFQAMMEVEAVNDGPVTLLLDSPKVI
jgi:D-aminoacyl-tRNA deacylase